MSFARPVINTVALKANTLYFMVTERNYRVRAVNNSHSHLAQLTGKLALVTFFFMSYRINLVKTDTFCSKLMLFTLCFFKVIQ